MNVHIGEDIATFRAEPEHGRPVTFEVRQRHIRIDTGGYWYTKRYADRFVVGLKGSDGTGFAHFTSFEKACRSALARARRYERAYSRQRGTQAVAA